MASSGMKEDLFSAKCGFIDQLEEKFSKKLQRFTKEVKGTMRLVSRQAANEVFEFALVFLTQTFPDLSDLGTSAPCSFSKGDEVVRLLEENIKKLSKQLNVLENRIQKDLSTRMDDLESKLPDGCILNNLSDRLCDLEAKVTENGGLRKVSKKLCDLEREVQDEISRRQTVEDKLQNDFDELSITAKSNRQNISGLRKLQKFLKSKTSPLPSSSRTASSQASVSAGGTLPKTIKSLSQLLTFPTNAHGDVKKPYILDMKLLPGGDGLVLLADLANSCLKLFNSLGDHIDRLTMEDAPLRIAIFKQWSSSGWDVAVTLKEKFYLALIHVTRNCATLKTTVPTSKVYWAVAAISSDTLAVGHWKARGIDLINLSGQALCQLSSDVSPDFMEVSPDGYLLVSTVNHEFVILRTTFGTIIFKDNVQNLPCPYAITCPNQDATSIVADRETRTLHLVNSRGIWEGQLWQHPAGGDSQDRLLCVTVLGELCLCCTLTGLVFVLNVA